jgi:hypothetical protein
MERMAIAFLRCDSGPLRIHLNNLSKSVMCPNSSSSAERGIAPCWTARIHSKLSFRLAPGAIERNEATRASGDSRVRTPKLICSWYFCS